MKKKKLFFVAIGLLAAMGSTSCKKESKNTTMDKSTSRESEDYAHPITLGQHLQNPYTISIMDSALALLSISNPTDAAQFNVRVTHKYVKFKPQNWAQYDILSNDTILKIYEFPLDYEVSVGDKYHDQAVAIDSPTYQYAVVPVNYSFPVGIPYDILDELYLPEQDAQLLIDEEPNTSLINKLVDKAMVLTGNFTDTIVSEDFAGNNMKTTWYPSGVIKVLDFRGDILFQMF